MSTPLFCAVSMLTPLFALLPGHCFHVNSSFCSVARALFPCGDSMVCIIDDREDVWNFASNLIHVKPYIFFDGTADINAPPAGDKSLESGEEGTEGQSGKHAKYSHPTRNVKVIRVPKHKGEGDTKDTAVAGTGGDKEAAQGDSGDKVMADNKEAGDRQETVTQNGDAKSTDTENGDAKSADTQNGDVKSTDTENGDGKVSEGSVTEPVSTDTEDKGDTEIGDSVAAVTETGDTVGGDGNSADSMVGVTVTQDSAAGDSKAGDNVASDSKEGEGAVTEAILADSGDCDPVQTESQTEQPDQPARTEDQAVPAVSDSDTDRLTQSSDAVRELEEGEIVSSDSETVLTTQPPGSQTHPPGTQPEAAGEEEYDEVVEWEDNDDYLIYLEDILKKIHHAFYEMYDQLKQKTDTGENSEGEIPDLKSIIPYVKRKVLKGVNVLFSGVIPTNQPMEKSRAYKVAWSLGAVVMTDFVPGETTHLVAAKLGTTKVRTAQKASGVQLVNPDWLWTCAERWERVDERLFPLTGDSSYPSVDSPAPGAKPIKRSASSKKLESEKPPAETEEGKPSTSEEGKAGGGRERRFSDSYNPLHTLDQAQLKEMDEEVDAMFNEESEDSEEDEDAVLRREVLNYGKKRPAESSDEDSLAGDYPKGWGKAQRLKRRRQEDESACNGAADYNGEDWDENDEKRRIVDNPSRVFNVSDQSSDSEAGSDYDDSVGSVDEEMAAAVEREFLSY